MSDVNAAVSNHFFFFPCTFDPTPDSEGFEPLEDFLCLVKEQRPKVFLLIGPFVDAKNELVINNNFQACHQITMVDDSQEYRL